MGDFQIFRCKSTRQGRAGLTPAVVDVRGRPWSTLVAEVLGFCAFGAEDA